MHHSCHGFVLTRPLQHQYLQQEHRVLNKHPSHGHCLDLDHVTGNCTASRRIANCISRKRKAEIDIAKGLTSTICSQLILGLPTAFSPCCLVVSSFRRKMPQLGSAEKCADSYFFRNVLDWYVSASLNNCNWLTRS